MGPHYDAEQFSAEERDILRPYFTNLTGPVFALVNLPEVVKSALFARYSRTHKSLRRLFLDEFASDLDMGGDETVDAGAGLGGAEERYAGAFEAFGDDSVAQMGVVHLGCEQGSIALTKAVERGRLMSYLEQSTRFLRYDHRLTNGRYRYVRSPTIMDGPMGTRYVGDMDRLFDAYAEVLNTMQTYYANKIKQGDLVDDFAFRARARERALDVARGMLPTGTMSNLGMLGSAQAYEGLLARMRAHPLPEVRDYARLMLIELRKVVPSFLRYVDDDRGGAGLASYLETNRVVMEEASTSLFGNGMSQTADDDPSSQRGESAVSLVDFDPDGENKVIAAMLFPYTHYSEAQLLQRVENMSADEKREMFRAYVGIRRDRRNKPGRAFEATSYRFEVCADYGSFRDLGRHRMLTLEWQDLTAQHGYVTPEPVEAAGVLSLYNEAMERSAELYEVLSQETPFEASYALALAYRVRYSMQMNAREALHVLELRTGRPGHAAYRRIAQQMHHLIAAQAGHKLLAEAMIYVDHMDYENVYASRSAAPERQMDG